MLKTTEERLSRLAEWRGNRRKLFHFNVDPRYTGGSPALVDGDTALVVAKQELDAYEHAQDERYGTRLAEKASSQGPAGIVEARIEERKGWDVLDLLTGERHLRPFPKP